MKFSAPSSQPELVSNPVQPVNAKKGKPPVALIVLLIAALVTNIYLFYQNYQLNKQLQQETDKETAATSPTQSPNTAENLIINENETDISEPSSQKNSITGKITAYRIDEKNGELTATFQMIAQSTEGNIIKMLVWTDKDNNNSWQDFSSLVDIPVRDIENYVYVKFQDEKGNTSETYSDSIHSQYSPPN